MPVDVPELDEDEVVEFEPPPQPTTLITLIAISTKIRKRWQRLRVLTPKRNRTAMEMPAKGNRNGMVALAAAEVAA